MASENDKNHRVRVAQYLRMSTDHQQYSLHNQSEYIKDYAEKTIWKSLIPTMMLVRAESVS